MMFSKLSRGLILGLALLVVLPQPVLADDTVTDVAEQLMCMCSCNALLPACMHVECGVQTAMTDYIQGALDRGESSPQIVAYFVAQYGDEVLSTLPKKGFNLMAWITPFAALILGGGIVYVALKKWVKHGEEDEGVAAAVGAEDGDGEYRARLEKELSEFSERSFR